MINQWIWSEMSWQHEILPADAIKTVWKRAIRKTADATGDLVGNENADIVITISKILKSHKIMKIIINQKH